MKKLLLITLALLTVGVVSIAAAQDGSLNLAWGTACRNLASNPAMDNQSSTVGGVACEDPTDPMTGAPTRTLTASFVNTQVVPGWSGTTTVVTFTVVGGFDNLNSIWSVQPGGCNQGALAPKGTLSIAILNCQNPYAITPTDGQTVLPNVAVQSPMVSYSNDRVRNTTQVNLATPTSVGGWVADQLIFDFDSGAQTQLCSGCGSAVDVKLTEIQYFSATNLYHAQAENLNRCSTWNLGTATHCAGGTPAQRSTWGSVKALYR